MGHGTGRKHPADAGIRDGQPFHHEKCPPAVSEEQKKVNDWERAGGIYMEMLERCKETLDEVVIPADEDVRFRAANRLLLILWEFVKEAF